MLLHPATLRQLLIADSSIWIGRCSKFFPGLESGSFLRVNARRKPLRQKTLQAVIRRGDVVLAVAGAYKDAGGNRVRCQPPEGLLPESIVAAFIVCGHGASGGGGVHAPAPGRGSIQLFCHRHPDWICHIFYVKLFAGAGGVAPIARIAGGLGPGLYQRFAGAERYDEFGGWLRTIVSGPCTFHSNS